MLSAGEARGQLCETAPEMSLDTWSQYANEVVYPNVSTPCGTFQHAAYLRFTAPQAGQYQFSAQGQCDYDRRTVFAVLGGCPSTESACLSGVYGSYCNEVLLAPISLAAGQQVVLVVGSANGAYPTSGQARVRYLPPVQPPKCSAAPEMSLDTWSQYANEVLYPNVSTPCGTFQHAAYLRFTAPQAGQYQFSAQGQCDYDRRTVFAVLGGCPSTESACLSGVYGSYCNEVLLAPISLAAGQQVVLVVGSANGAYPTSGQARVRYLPPVQPPECSAAPEMSLDTWSQYANEVLYPNVSTPCGTFQHAAYLRFTAPQAGQYQFSAQGQCDYDRRTVFAVLGGCPSTESACLSGVYGSYCNEVLLAPISLAAGQQVVLVVGSANGAYPTSGQARVRYLPPVQPPECSAAPEMSLDTWSQYANEVLYPNVSTPCGTFQHAAYLRFTAPQAGQYQFSAQGQCDYDRRTVFAVLGGCPSTESACLSGVYGSYCNEVLLAPISLAAGQQVVLVVGSANGAYPTSGQARVRYLPPVQPPECSAAPEMSLDTWSQYANEVLYPNVPTPCGTFQHAAYLRFTAPQAGQYQFSAQGQCDYDRRTVFAVLGGCPSTESACLSGVYGSYCNEVLLAPISLAAGQQVVLVVGSANGAYPTSGQARVRYLPECTNDFDGDGVNDCVDGCPLNPNLTAPVSYYADADGDGFGAGAPTASCTAISNRVTNNLDCDDSRLLYADNDGDGYGAGAMIACGGVNSIDDCNDNDASVYPGAAEVCANLGTDNDCDSINSDDEAIDSIDYFVDGDQDGFGAGAPMKSCSPIPGSVPNADDCDDTQVTFADADADGFGSGPWIACGTATNDADCDDTRLLYADADGDGYGAGGPIACGVTSNSDCNDSDSSVHPSAIEYCNDTDDDCDGTVDGGACSLPATQWSRSNGGNGHWYLAVDAATGLAAEAYAAAHGAHLATISNAAENAFVFQIYLGSGRQWGYLGFVQAQGQATPAEGWYWTNGEPVNYTNWSTHNGAFPTGAPDDSPCALPPWGVEDDQADQCVMQYDGRWDDIERGMPTCGSPVWNNTALLEFDADCNNDGIVDYGQILAGEIADANGNNIPDCCEGGGNCPGAPVQWRVEDGGNGHWYGLTEQAGTWDQAKLLARDAAGELVSISNDGENEVVHRLVAGTAGSWIGASKLPQQPWTWADGSPWGYVHWCPGEPCCGDAGLYVYLSVGGCWDDHNQTETLRRGVIEWSSDCNNDGLVDYGQILDGTLADANHNNVPDSCECFADTDGDGTPDCTDGCPLNPALNAPIAYFADNDGDGFGAGAASMSCDEIAGSVTNDYDCDDTQLLYADNDGDGFGAGAPVACGVASNSDCDDGNNAINPLASEACDGTDNNCNGAIDEGVCGNDAMQIAEWSVSDGGNGHYYALVKSGPITWNQARVAAQALGGHLATVTTPEENNFVATLAADPTAWNDSWLGPWLGGHQTPGSLEPGNGWYWVTGEPWDWTHWLPGDPDNAASTGPCSPEDALHYFSPAHSGPSAGWNDAPELNPCVTIISFMVEWDADCNHDGAIDYGQVHAGQLADANGNNTPDSCEQSIALHVDWVDLTSDDGGTPATVAGTIHTPNGPVEVTYHGERLFSYLDGGEANWSPSDPYLSASVPNGPPSTDIISLVGGGVATGRITFSRAVTNPVMAVVSLGGGGGATARLEFNVPFEILSNGASRFGNGPFYKQGNTLAGNEGSGLIRFQGTFTEVGFAMPVFEHWYGFTVGIAEGGSDCDRDGVNDYDSVTSGGVLDGNGNTVPDSCEHAPAWSETAVQWPVEQGGNGHWYEGVFVSSAGVTWTDARALAIAKGGDLVSLNTPQERQWVFANVANNPSLWSTRLGPWVGGFQLADSNEPAGGWMWVDGTPLYDGFFWDGAHPDGNDNCGGPANRMTYWGNYVAGAGDLFADCADNAQLTCWNIDFGPHYSYVVEYSADCNNDGLVDFGQILDGTLVDSNHNNIPDSCECTADSDGDGTPDCTDGCPSNPELTAPIAYYADGDSDGFGAGAATMSCSAIAGSVGNNSDCDDAFVMYADNDGDGYGAGAMIACGGVNSIDDCNDNDASVYPGAAEVCANLGTDNDCDSINSDDEAIDSIDYFVDGDQDGFGAGAQMKSCSPIPGSVPNADDCDDTQVTFADADADGFGSGPWIACGTATNDADCDDTRLLYADADGDGYGAGGPIACGVTSNSDCNDSDSSVHPSAIEYCNDTDDDCDGTVDGGACSLPATQWSRSNGGNGHWYLAVDAATGLAAEAYAAAHGAHLATISNAAENAFVFQIYLGSGRQWGYLGFVQAQGQATPAEGWYWTNGEPVNYTNWSTHNGAFPTGAPDDSPCALPPWGVEDDQADQCVMQYDGRWDDIERGMPTCGSPVWNNTALLEFDADCNNDGIVDYGQILAGEIADANGNNIPDCCEGGGNCPGAPVQWRVEDGGNGHWYGLTEQAGTWDQAKLLARDAAGELVSISNDGENEVVHRLVAGTAGSWIGASKLPQQPWTWADGSPWGYVHWCPGEPCCGDAGLYVYLSVGGCWDDHNQTETLRRGVIEWSSDCNNDGIVDYGQILDGTLVDANHNHIPDECECTGDLDHDGFVGSSDLSLLLTSWGGATPSIADIDGDGEVNAADMALLLSHWGICTH